MEAVIVGGLCGGALVLAVVLWQLYVRPDVILSFFEDDGVTGPPDRVEHGPALPLLRWAVGVAVFGVGFVTGAVLSFLAATGG